MHEEAAQQSGQNMWLKLLLVAATGILLGTVVFFFGINRFALSIRLQGERETVIPYGQSYTDPGADLRFGGTRVLTQGIRPDVQIAVNGSVNPDKVGTYMLTYTARFWLWRTQARRFIHVVDRVAPEITLVADPEYRTIYGEAYQEEGFSAWDEYDGDITKYVLREEKDGTVTYTVQDRAGNSATTTRQILYHDPVPPVIRLLGDSCTLTVGRAFQEPGFTATDNHDGDVTQGVTVSGDLNRFVPGDYTLEYSATDSFGNTATVTRTVTVEAVPRVPVEKPEGKVIYLTFDDGPGPYTAWLLDILAKYDVKATFFITGTGYPELLRRMAAEGHALGIHSVTHNYRQIYAGEEAYFQDLFAMQQHIYDQTGVMTTLMRFPGGSSNTVSRFNPKVMTRLSQAVQDAGFQYFDWNSDSRDAGGAKNDEEVFRNVTGGVQAQRHSVVLQHDVQWFSVAAVERIILWGLNNGYTFLPLEPSSPVCHHPLLN